MNFILYDHEKVFNSDADVYGDGSQFFILLK